MSVVSPRLKRALAQPADNESPKEAFACQCLTWRVFASENRFMLCISPSGLSPFSVQVSMECCFSDKIALVAEATASFQPIHI
jgi:hypothetical protein